ncbi:MAG: nuclear transport factor 2 family protein [Acidimicrobiales bacterium]
MERWELEARESIRDLVARYNANGDAGRYEQVLAVFADDAVMEVRSRDGPLRRYEGREAIAGLLEAAAADFAAGTPDGAAPPAGPEPAGGARVHYVRHFTGTDQIDLVDRTHARGRCYFFVVMPHGPDHWGRYLDEYGVSDGRWVITRRQALSDPRPPPPAAPGPL